MGEGSEMPPPLRFKYIYTFKLNKTFNYGGHRKIISYGGRGTEWGVGGGQGPPLKNYGVCRYKLENSIMGEEHHT